MFHDDIPKSDVFHHCIISVMYGNHRLMKIMEYRNICKFHISNISIRLVALICLISYFHRLREIRP